MTMSKDRDAAPVIPNFYEAARAIVLRVHTPVWRRGIESCPSPLSQDPKAQEWTEEIMAALRSAYLAGAKKGD